MSEHKADTDNRSCQLSPVMLRPALAGKELFPIGVSERERAKETNEKEPRLPTFSPQKSNFPPMQMSNLPLHTSMKIKENFIVSSQISSVIIIFSG